MQSLRGMLTVMHLRSSKSYILRHNTMSGLFHKKFLHQQIPIPENTGTTSVSCEKSSATLSASGDIISVRVNNHILKLPSIWLRDNCQCPSCFQKESQSRTIDWSTFDFNTKPLSTKFEVAELTVEWSDQHKSTFSLEWLIERSFTQDKRRTFRNRLYKFERITWGAQEFPQCFKKFDYRMVLNEDTVLLEWLESLTTYGVAILTDVPSQNCSTKTLTKRVAFARKTHYGEEFIVQAKDDASNVAYLSATLPLHTDLPYYHYKPGVNLLHCLVQSQGQGGESHLTDAFHVAKYMKSHHPEAYEVLVKTMVDWSDIGHENGNHFHSLHQAPVLCEDAFGDLVRVNFSQPQRDSHFNAPLELVTAWYAAAGLFTKLVYSTENAVTFKLAEGELLTFDNHRMLHGRSAYVDAVGRERVLIGCYLDWDEIYSRIRVLRKQLTK